MPDIEVRSRKDLNGDHRVRPRSRARIATVLVIVLSGLSSYPAKADAQTDFSALQLLDWCKGSQVGNCLSFISGFTKGIELGQQFGRTGTPQVCIVPGVTAAQMQLIFEKVASDHLRILNEDAATVLGLALVQYFPCQPGQIPP